MDGESIPPQDDAPVAAAADEVDIAFPDDPRVPQPDDADPTVSKELGGAAPAVEIVDIAEPEAGPNQKDYDLSTAGVNHADTHRRRED
jgi:hypothetical protein